MHYSFVVVLIERACCLPFLRIDCAYHSCLSFARIVLVVRVQRSCSACGARCSSPQAQRPTSTTTAPATAPRPRPTPRTLDTRTTPTTTQATRTSPRGPGPGGGRQGGLVS